MVGALVASPPGEGPVPPGDPPERRLDGSADGEDEHRRSTSRRAPRRWPSGRQSIAELRAKTAVEAGGGLRTPARLVIDGYLIPEDLSITFANGKQNDVELLAGSNKDENTFFRRRAGRGRRTADGFRHSRAAALRRAGRRFLKLYPRRHRRGGRGVLNARRYSDEINWNMRQSAALQTKKGKKAYAYFFTRVPLHATASHRRAARRTPRRSQYVFNNPHRRSTGTTTTRSSPTRCRRTGSTSRPRAIPTVRACRRGRCTRTRQGRVMVLGDTIAGRGHVAGGEAGLLRRGLRASPARN